VAVVAAPVVVAMPTAPVLVAACTIPTLLGFWRSEYGVSYAYAIATLATGALVIKAAKTKIAALHAGCLCLYGLRLGLFLVYRELNIQRFREFRDKIETRAEERGSRISRTPFIMSCSVLYLGLAAPLMITAPAAAMNPAAAVAIFCMYAGWAVATIGDLQKSWVKASEGPDALVTSGLYSFFRHPNYTGEMLLWTSSLAAAVITAAAGGTIVTAAGWLALAVLGAVGINFVLLQATAGLEKKQKEKYAGQSSEQYEKWIKTAWSGPMLPSS